MHVPGMASAHIRPPHGNAIVLQELPHEVDVPAGYIAEGRLQIEHVGAAKDLGDEPPAVTADLHGGADQAIHRVHAEAQRVVSRRVASGQHEVIHSAHARHGVVEADGDARAEQGLDHSRTLAGVKAADVDPDFWRRARR